jgi:tetratricopeptide (TPR) repeat protein
MLYRLDRTIYLIIFQGNAEISPRYQFQKTETAADQIPMQRRGEISADTGRIKETARWAGLDENAIWHMRVAPVIREYSSAADAIEEYKLALEKDPNLGFAHKGLSFAHDMLHQRKEAIMHLRLARVCEDIKGDTEEEIFMLSWYLSKWLLEDNQGGEAFETSHEMLKRNPRNHKSLALYIYVASRVLRNKEIMNALHNLREQLPAFLLSQSNGEVNGLIRRAAQKHRRLWFLKSAYASALEISQKQSDYSTSLRVRFCLADIYSENQEEQAAVELWTKIYELVRDSTKYEIPLTSAITRLCGTYCLSAISSISYATECTSYINRLSALQKQVAVLEVSLFEAKYSPSIYLGLIYKLQSNDTESRRCFRKAIMGVMAALTTDNLLERWSAYLVLSDSLFKFGDITNGKASKSYSVLVFRQISERKGKLLPLSLVEKAEEKKEVSGESRRTQPQKLQIEPKQQGQKELNNTRGR